ncbi:hypothetical protein P7C70_g6658, partial [Phenoliferia sp. Uapishka_3]
MTSTDTEFTPLLHPSSSDVQLIEDSSPRAEVKRLTLFIIPTYITLNLEMSLYATTVVVVGHLGTTELAAASIASMTANVVAFSWMQGMVWSVLSPLPSLSHSLATNSVLPHPQRTRHSLFPILHLKSTLNIPPRSPNRFPPHFNAHSTIDNILARRANSVGVEAGSGCR